MTICSHTLVRNGMPFIDLALRQVIPHVDRCLVTLSKRSQDGTSLVLNKLQQEYPAKIFIEYENVKAYSDLTQERQKQLNKTTEDWVLFLDDDDIWPEKSLLEIKTYLTRDVDALAINPYQVIDKQYYDLDWRYKWFTKWFRKQKGVHYEKPWPRDLLYLNDKMLYWKKNPRVPRVYVPYFHLSNIKKGSFRKEIWAEKYQESIGQQYFIPELYKPIMEKIYSYL